MTDLDTAVDFYTKTLGWYVIMPPTEVVSDDSAIGVMCNDVGVYSGLTTLAEPAIPRKSPISDADCALTDCD